MATTAEKIRAHIAERQAAFAALEAKINPLKAKRDAFIAKHRAVYDTERAMANTIKALQEEAVPIAMELRELRKLVGGSAASG